GHPERTRAGGLRTAGPGQRRRGLRATSPMERSRAAADLAGRPASGPEPIGRTAPTPPTHGATAAGPLLHCASARARSVAGPGASRPRTAHRLRKSDKIRPEIASKQTDKSYAHNDLSVSLDPWGPRRKTPAGGPPPPDLTVRSNDPPADPARDTRRGASRRPGLPRYRIPARVLGSSSHQPPGRNSRRCGQISFNVSPS